MQNDRNDTFTLSGVHAHVAHARNSLMVGGVISVIFGYFQHFRNRLTGLFEHIRRYRAHVNNDGGAIPIWDLAQ